MKDAVNDIQYGAVPPHLISELWPFAEPFLEPAVRRGVDGRTMVDVLDGVINGDYLLWLVTEDSTVIAACVTEIVVYPRHKVLVLPWCGGKGMKRWLRGGFDIAERYAKDVGCSHLEIPGRRGWSRILNKMGWSAGYTLYRREVS
jgi:hypothetical protein